MSIKSAARRLAVTRGACLSAAESSVKPAAPLLAVIDILRTSFTPTG
ncbi:MAG: hypothetical protein AB7Q17_04205 [Phycisphaerae bacterium]